jgi:hypothetical protein
MITKQDKFDAKWNGLKAGKWAVSPYGRIFKVGPVSGWKKEASGSITCSTDSDFSGTIYSAADNKWATGIDDAELQRFQKHCIECSSKLPRYQWIPNQPSKTICGNAVYTHPVCDECGTKYS